MREKLGDWVSAGHGKACFIFQKYHCTYENTGGRRGRSQEQESLYLTATVINRVEGIESPAGHKHRALPPPTQSSPLVHLLLLGTSWLHAQPTHFIYCLLFSLK